MNPDHCADLVVDGLAKRYDDSHVLREVTFTLPPGLRAGLVGANGAGKSALIRTLAGLVVAGSDAAAEAVVDASRVAALRIDAAGPPG